MSVLTLPAPTVPDAGDDNDPHHYYCCDQNRSLCGLDVTAYPEVVEANDALDCPLCVLLLEEPCGAAGCPT